MATAPRALTTTARRSLVRSKLQQLVEKYLPPNGDIDVSTQRDRILREMDPGFAQEAGMVLLDEAVHSLVLSAVHRRRSIFEGRVTKSQKRFDEALDAWTNGDDEALEVWQQRYVVDKSQTMRPVAEMVRPDLLFIAEGYQKRGNRELLRSTFFRLLATRLPDDVTTVQDALNEGEYATLYRETFVPSATIQTTNGDDQ